MSMYSQHTPYSYQYIKNSQAWLLQHQHTCAHTDYHILVQSITFAQLQTWLLQHLYPYDLHFTDVSFVSPRSTDTFKLTGLMTSATWSGGSFLLACEDFGRMLDNSFPACAFFFFKVEISSHALFPLFKPGSVHSGSASWDDCDQAFPDE